MYGRAPINQSSLYVTMAHKHTYLSYNFIRDTNYFPTTKGQIIKPIILSAAPSILSFEIHVYISPYFLFVLFHQISNRSFAIKKNVTNLLSNICQIVYCRQLRLLEDNSLPPRRTKYTDST